MTSKHGKIRPSHTSPPSAPIVTSSTAKLSAQQSHPLPPPHRPRMATGQLIKNSRHRYTEQIHASHMIHLILVLLLCLSPTLPNQPANMLLCSLPAIHFASSFPPFFSGTTAAATPRPPSAWSDNRQHPTPKLRTPPPTHTTITTTTTINITTDHNIPGRFNGPINHIHWHRACHGT